MPDVRHTQAKTDVISPVLADFIGSSLSPSEILSILQDANVDTSTYHLALQASVPSPEEDSFLDNLPPGEFKALFHHPHAHTDPSASLWFKYLIDLNEFDRPARINALYWFWATEEPPSDNHRQSVVQITGTSRKNRKQWFDVLCSSINFDFRKKGRMLRDIRWLVEQGLSQGEWRSWFGNQNLSRCMPEWMLGAAMKYQTGRKAIIHCAQEVLRIPTLANLTVLPDLVTLFSTRGSEHPAAVPGLSPDELARRLRADPETMENWMLEHLLTRLRESSDSKSSP